MAAEPVEALWGSDRASSERLTMGVRRCQYCGTELQTTWRYCVHCGTTTAELDAFARDVALEPVSIGRGVTDVRRRVELRNVGYAPLRLRASLADAPAWVRLANDGELTIAAQSPAALGLQFSVDAMEPGEFSFDVALEHDDGCRSAMVGSTVNELTWRSRFWVRDTVRVHVDVLERQGLRIDQELLVFSHQLTEQHLTLRNSNTDPMGFSVSAPAGIEHGASAGGKLVVPGRNGATYGTSDVLVKIDASRWIARERGGEHEIAIRDEIGVEHRVAIFVMDEGRTAPAVPLVVGIDFGTDNTSVYVREPGSTDPPESVPILGSEKPRVPSYIAYEMDNPVPKFFGEDAKNLLTLPQKLKGDYRIEFDVKKWLGSADDSSRLALRDYLKRLYSDIEDFLVRRGFADYAGIKFVFTLPVLDQGEIYERQLQAMRDAILRAFAPRVSRGTTDTDDFVFITEPQAAAACFLFDESVIAQLGLPGYEDGDLVAVVDSGAGTTDLALVRVTGERGIDTFEVLGVRGTLLVEERAEEPGEQGADSVPATKVFGGRWVDGQLLDLMAASAADCVNQVAGPSEDGRSVDADDMHGYLRECLASAGLRHKAPEKYVEMLKPDFFLKEFDEHQVQLPELAVISDEVVKKNHDVQGYLSSFAVTRKAFRERLEATQVLDRVVLALDGLMHEDSSRERIEALPMEKQRLKYLFAVGGNSRLPLLIAKLKEYFPGTIVLPGEVPSWDDEDGGSIRMTAVARGSVWSIARGATSLIPFRLTLRSPGRSALVLMRENSHATTPMPRHRFQVRRGQPYEAEVHLSLPQGERRIGRIVYEPKSEGYELVARELRFEISEDWVLTATVDGDEFETGETVMRYAIR